MIILMHLCDDHGKMENKELELELDKFVLLFYFEYAL